MIPVDCVLELREGGGPKGECPVWEPREGCLYWCDIDGGTLNRFDPGSGRNQSRSVGEKIGSFAMTDAMGVFLIATRSGLHRFTFATGAKEFVLHPEPHLPDNRLNDGRCDPAGRFWVGSMRDPIRDTDRCGSLYRIDPDLTCSRMVEGLGITNGIAISPDRSTFYLSDSNTHVRTIWQFDFDLERGTLENRRLFAHTGPMGRPDGACCDVEGGYWCAHIDGWRVVRYDHRGRVDAEVVLPVQWPTMCAFGGAERDVLYITTIRRGGPGADLPDQPLAGSLFACKPGVVGLHEPQFGRRWT